MAKKSIKKVDQSDQMEEVLDSRPFTDQEHKDWLERHGNELHAKSEDIDVRGIPVTYEESIEHLEEEDELPPEYLRREDVVLDKDYILDEHAMDYLEPGPEQDAALEEAKRASRGERQKMGTTPWRLIAAATSDIEEHGSITHGMDLGRGVLLKCMEIHKGRVAVSTNWLAGMSLVVDKDNTWKLK